MNNQSLYSIGPLMKAARKFRKLNQADVAQAIGCSQSALSKMEHDLLVPSAPQWFLFARFTSIAPESLEAGIIDRHLKVKFNDDQVSLGFKIPKRYRLHRAEKVREIYPFLQYLEKNMKPPLHSEFMLSTGLDAEFFLDFDNLISFQLFLDAADFFLKLGLGSSEEIKEIVRMGQNEIYWDDFDIEWRKLESTQSLLEAFAREQVFFQSDFQIKVENLTGKVIVNYYPEYHLKQMATNAAPELIGFLNTYRAATLENLVDKFVAHRIHVDLIPEVAASPLAARFEVRAA